MRLLKKWDKVNFNDRTDRLDPFRSFYLTQEEMNSIRKLPKDDRGDIQSSIESEALLRTILEARNMESLLYPEREQDDWSGFVKLFDNGLFWML